MTWGFMTSWKVCYRKTPAKRACIPPACPSGSNAGAHPHHFWTLDHSSRKPIISGLPSSFEKKSLDAEHFPWARHSPQQGKIRPLDWSGDRKGENQTCHSPENQEFLGVFPDLCDGHSSLSEHLGRGRMTDIRKYTEERILGLLDPKNNC